MVEIYRNRIDMYFYNLMIDMSKNKNVDLYVEMDGVIAEYGINKKNPYDYKNKRPLTQNIKTLEDVSKVEGINRAFHALHKVDRC